MEISFTSRSLLLAYAKALEHVICDFQVLQPRIRPGVVKVDPVIVCKADNADESGRLAMHTILGIDAISRFDTSEASLADLARGPFDALFALQAFGRIVGRGF